MKKTKIEMEMPHGESIEEVYTVYLRNCQTKGLSSKSILTYGSHFKAIRRFLDTKMPIFDLAKKDFDDMIIAMRGAGLTRNSIASYVQASLLDRLNI